MKGLFYLCQRFQSMGGWPQQLGRTSQKQKLWQRRAVSPHDKQGAQGRTGLQIQVRHTPPVNLPPLAGPHFPKSPSLLLTVPPAGYQADHSSLFGFDKLYPNKQKWDPTERPVKDQSCTVLLEWRLRSEFLSSDYPPGQHDPLNLSNSSGSRDVKKNWNICGLEFESFKNPESTFSIGIIYTVHLTVMLSLLPWRNWKEKKKKKKEPLCSSPLLPVDGNIAPAFSQLFSILDASKLFII